MSGAAPADMARGRAQVYELLSAVFRRPLDAALIKGLKEPEMLAALAAAGIDPGPDFAEAPETALREALAIDFTHIFHAPEGKIMPFEGMMLSGEDELKGKRTEAVERFMADVGYRVPPETGEMADHIAVELAFMADLARREAEAAEAGDAASAGRAREIQSDFLRRHLGQWLHVFRERASARAESEFYRSMARAVAEFVAADLDEFNGEPAGAA